MKKFLLLSFLAVIFMIPGTPCQAAGSNDHELYKVVTYTFNTQANSGLTVSSKNTTRFNPLMITGTKTDILSSPQSDHNRFDYSTGKNNAQGFVVSADIHATPKLAIQGVIGITKNNTVTSFNTNFDSSWEANLGVIYKLFNHLSYEMHFGFMDTGDIFKSNNAYSDVESIVMLSNQLTMSF